MNTLFGADSRRVERREHLGKPALAVVAARVYDTTIEDLWDAISTPERLARWFLGVEGDFRVGGRFQIQGNASGTIIRCDRPQALDVTWEYGGATSWVNVRLTREGGRARLVLEHIAHSAGIGEAHLKQFGPGAVGIGWDLTLHGLATHVAAPAAPVDPAAVEAWTRSSDGKAFMRGSGEAWGVADAGAGEDRDEARAKAERTIAFYTGG